jgi:hypothetical protein
MPRAPATKSPHGKPSGVKVYKPEFVPNVERLGRLGATLEQMADFFGVTRAAIQKWMRRYPDFAAALNQGRLWADTQVTESLYRRAMGYDYEAERVVVPVNGAAPVHTKFKVHVPAHPTACIFWLRNRRPDLWRDTWRHEHTGRNGVVLPPAPLDEIEVARRVAFLLAKADAAKAEEEAARARAAEQEARSKAKGAEDSAHVPTADRGGRSKA